ncbi:MAG: PilZ domain-containing protein [Pyrinomonadaceae bacterium]
MSYPFETSRALGRDRRNASDVQGLDRRSEPRMHLDMHAKVCGTDLLERTFETSGRVENISHSGLYVELGERVGVGAKLLIFVRPLSVSVETETTPFGVVRGIVMRVEPRAEGRAGLGIRITHRRQEGKYERGTMNDER